MQTSPFKRWIAPGIIGATVVLLVIAAVFTLRKPQLDFDPMVGRAFLPPIGMPPFSLTDQGGQPFTRESLNGHWTIAMIGFTYCPDICPTTLLEIASFYKKIETGSDRVTPPEFVFFSVDPFRDTPEVVGKYVAYFHPGFTGVTGEPAEISGMVKELGLYYAYTDQEDDHILDDVLRKPAGEDYGVIHSTSLLFISPDAELVAMMSSPFKPDNILTFLKKLRAYYGD